MCDSNVLDKCHVIIALHNDNETGETGDDKSSLKRVQHGLCSVGRF